MNIEKIKNLILKNKENILWTVVAFFVVILVVANTFSPNRNIGFSENSIKMEKGIMMNSKANTMDTMELSSRKYSPNTPVEENFSGQYDGNIERKIIKNGNMSLVVKNIDIATEGIKNIIKSFNGFVSSSNFSDNEDYTYIGGKKNSVAHSKSGYIEVKVPSKNFDQSFSEIKKLALKVNSESINDRDVTEEFSDLETQIKNKRVETEQYRKIFKKAIKIEDVLKVTQYLNTAQGQLDRLQGRMNYLSNQVELSSIRINIISEKDVEVFGIVWSPLTELKQGFTNMIEDFKDFSNDIIFFIFKLPILIVNLIIIVMILLISKKVFLKLKNKFWKSKKIEEEN